MANATVAVDCLEAFQIGCDFAPEITFKHPFVLGDDVENLVELLFGQVLSAHVGIEPRFFDEGIRPRGADAVDVTEGVRDFLFRGDFYTEETRHMWLGLKLTEKKMRELKLTVRARNGKNLRPVFGGQDGMFEVG